MNEIIKSLDGKKTMIATILYAVSMISESFGFTFPPQAMAIIMGLGGVGLAGKLNKWVK